jgi:hypothetical protein
MRYLIAAMVIAFCAVCSASQLYAQTCDDGNKCTVNDTCHNGACVGTPVQCAASSDPCVENFCNPATGACDSRPVVCNDDNPCTVDACVPGEGCTFTNKADDTSCDDVNDCTTTDHCVSGSCVGSNVTDGTVCGGFSAGDTCRAECEAGACNVNAKDGIICLTGEACSVTCSSGFCGNDTCQEGADPCTVAHCSETGCAAIDRCPAAQFTCGETGACNPQTGTCLITPTNEGASCDDGNTCTANDRCTGGICRGDPLGVLSTQPAPALSLPWQLFAAGALSVLGVYLLRRSKVRR